MRAHDWVSEPNPQIPNPSFPMTGAKILIIVSAILVVLSGLTAVIFILLPLISDGKTSVEEAMPGWIIGSACCSFSFLGLIGGVVWLLIARSKK